MRSFLPLCLLLATPAWASPEPLPDAAPHEVNTLELVRVPERLVLDVVREGLPPVEDVAEPTGPTMDPEVDLIAGGMGGKALSASEATELARRGGGGVLGRLLATDKELPGRGGVGPWQLFDGEHDESGCRSPAVAGSADVVAVVCRGWDRSRPTDEHLVVLRGRRIERHPTPVSPGAVPSVSTEGARVSVVLSEGGDAVLHLLDLDERLDVRITGPWSGVQRPRLSGRGEAVAFTAQIGRRPAALVVRDDQDVAFVAWEDRRVGVDGIADDGNRLLVRAPPGRVLSSLFVDLARAVWLDLGAFKGDVQDAVLHPSGEAAVFVSRVGGVCGLFWADLTTRRRSELAGTTEGCFSAVDLDDQRRFVLYEQSDSAARSVQLYDRRSRLPWMTLPAGCAEAAISGDGYYVVARCSHDPRGRGVYLFAVPQENPAP